MKSIEKLLEPINSYFNSLYQNPEKGWYELEIGIPNGWIFESNEDVDYEVLRETNVGKLLRIFPKNEKITADDLMNFVEILIQTNGEMEATKLQIEEEMNQMKAQMEEKLAQHYKQLDEMKANAFLNTKKKEIEDPIINN